MYMSASTVSTRASAPSGGRARVPRTRERLVAPLLGALILAVALCPLIAFAAPPPLPTIRVRTSLVGDQSAAGTQLRAGFVVELIWEVTGPRRPALRWRDLTRSPLLADPALFDDADPAWLVPEELVLAPSTPRGSAAGDPSTPGSTAP